jgi:outer membrane murein-binding lipoprotein Lpp
MDQLLKDKMDGLEKDMRDLSSKMGNLYIAILGSDITKDGGMVGRIIQLEAQVKTLESKVEEMETAKVKTELYVKIMWGMVGAFASGIFLYVLNLIFYKK